MILIIFKLDKIDMNYHLWQCVTIYGSASE